MKIWVITKSNGEEQVGHSAEAAFHTQEDGIWFVDILEILYPNSSFKISPIELVNKGVR